MFEKKTSRSTKKSRSRMVELRVNSPRIFFFSCLRAGGGMIRIGLVLAILVSVCFLGRWGFQKFFVENDEFVINNIPLTIMETERTPLFLDFKRIEEFTGLQLSTSIFAVDTDELEEKLIDLPEITDAKVVRRMPGTLKISVTERMPVAWIECEVLGIEGRNLRKGRLVDEEGVVFPCASNALWRFSKHLPVVALPIAPEKGITSGETIDHEGFEHAFELAKLASEELKDKWRWIASKCETRSRWNWSPAVAHRERFRISICHGSCVIFPNFSSMLTKRDEFWRRRI